MITKFRKRFLYRSISLILVWILGFKVVDNKHDEKGHMTYQWVFNLCLFQQTLVLLRKVKINSLLCVHVVGLQCLMMRLFNAPLKYNLVEFVEIFCYRYQYHTTNELLIALWYSNINIIPMPLIQRKLFVVKKMFQKSLKFKNFFAI